MAVADRVLVAIAVVAVLTIDALYLAIIRSQDGPPTPDVLTVPFVASYLGLMATLLAASLFVPVAARPALRGAASGGLLVLGVLSAFSIGVAVMLAAAPAIAATVLAINARPGAKSVVAAAIAAVLSVVLMAAGFEVAWNHLVCPPTGESGGTTASLLGNGSSYDCSDGVLTVH